MKKIIVFLFMIVISSFAFSQTNIKDLKPSSPSYPHVIRMIENGIMTLDNQGRFNGSETMPKYDIAVFGSKILDYLEGIYGNKIVDFENRIAYIEQAKPIERIENLESMVNTFDLRIENYDQDVKLLTKQVSDILKVITPGENLEADNVIYKNIVENTNKVAEKAAKEELQKISEETLVQMTEFNKKMENFEKQVQLLNQKYDKNTEYLNTLIMSNEQKSREELKNYVDMKFNNEIDALKTTLRNIANSEIGYYSTTLESTLMKMDSRIVNIENSIKDINTLNLNSYDSKLNDIEAKLKAYENKIIDSTLDDKDPSSQLIKAEIESLKIDLNKIQNEIKGIQDSNKYNKSYIESFDQREKYYINLLNQTNEKFDNLSSELIFQGKKIDSLMFQISKNDINKSEENTYDPQMQNLTQRISSLERFMSIYSDQIGQIDIYSKGFEDLENKVQKNSDIIQKINSEDKKYKEDYEQLNSKINSITNLINVTNEDITKLGDIKLIGTRIGSIEQKYEIINENSFNNKNNIQDLNYRLSNLEKSISNFDINKEQINKLNESYEELIKKYYNLLEEIDSQTNLKTALDDVKLELRNEISSEFIARDSRIERIERDITSIQEKEYNNSSDENINYVGETLAKQNTQEIEKLQKKVEELEKPNTFNLWSTVTTGIVGVAVGAAITWFILSSGL
jgi:DNA repair exonuclease SbcCD ATPase subunit